MTREDFKMVLQFFFTFGVTAGSILTGAMLETGSAQMPRQAVVLLAVLTGFGVAMQRAQAVMEGKPQEDLRETVRQLVAQMRTVQVATAQQLPPPPEPPAIPVRVAKEPPPVLPTPFPGPGPKPRED
jgi:hypothetical protein